MRVMARNGEERWLSDSAIELFDNANISYASVGIMEDITDRKLTEFNLRKRESILEAITFSAEQFLKTTDWREKINAVLARLGSEFNASHAYLFEKHSVSNGEIVSSMTYEWTAPGLESDLEAAEFQDIPENSMGFERMYEILDSGEPLIGSASILTDAEKGYLASINVMALLEIRVVIDGKHWGTLGVDDISQEREWTSMEVDVIKVAASVLGAAIKRQMDDDALKNELTERKRTEQALIFSEEKFSKAFHTIPVMMSIEDANNIFIDVNKAFTDSIGFEREDVIGRRASDLNILFSPEDVKKAQTILNEQNAFRDIELSFRQKSGKTFSVLMSIEEFLVNNATYTLTSALDITDRKQAEAEREKLIDELEAKNEELERFTYTVSHDLKSPLVTINGFLGYLEQDATSGNIERLKKDIHRIHDAVNKMQQLLNELLELSRIGRMMNAPEAIAFDNLVKETINIVYGQLEAHSVTVQVQPELPLVYGDKPRLMEVLQNLLDNAAKYMGNQPSPQVEIGQYGDENDKSIFYVKDNGIGIAPEYYDRIFGLFNKLDAKSEGTGVGLALVKRIIEIHGGRVWVESETGLGSTFFFTLPKPPDLRSTGVK
jgi:PAS domain S-box-containing protein